MTGLSGCPYTHKIANDPHCKRHRKLSIKMTSLSWIDKIQEYMSILTMIFILGYLCLGLFVLFPSIICGFVYHKVKTSQTTKTQRSENVSTTTGSMSAIKVLTARAILAPSLLPSPAGGRIFDFGGPDILAPRLLKVVPSFGLYFIGCYTFTSIYMFLCQINILLTKRIFTDQLVKLFMTKIMKVGEVSYLHLRTCYLDDVLEEFVRRNGRKDTSTSTNNSTTATITANVVILGAGYDTRCYRFENLYDRGIQTFEIDAMGTQRNKINALQKLKIIKNMKNNNDKSSSAEAVPEFCSINNTKFIPCDFVTQDWMEECLLRQGNINLKLPTLFIWEGVTMYLPKHVIEKTLFTVSKYCKHNIHSCIAFDYFYSSWALSTTLTKLSKKGGEGYLFGIDNDQQVSELLSNNGLHLVGHMKHKELIQRYLPTHYDGTPIGFVDDFGGYVLAGYKNAY